LVVKPNGLTVMYVAVPPRITRGPVSRSEVEGSSVTLQCRVVAAPYPDTVVSWSKDGHLFHVRHQSTLTQRTLRSLYDKYHQETVVFGQINMT